MRPPLVSFRHSFRFAGGDTLLTSESTLVFRSVDEITATLASTGFEVHDISDAPDRPGREHVIVARRTSEGS